MSSYKAPPRRERPPHLGELDDSPFWGTSTIEYTCGVNSKDAAYHRAYKNFLVRLIEARKQAGLTQVEVAKRLGRAHSFISKCELGERRVDFVELRQLAQIYKKTYPFSAINEVTRLTGK